MDIYTFQFKVHLQKFMSIKINYTKKNSFNASVNTVFFVNEKFELGNIKKYISNNEISYIKDLLKINKKKKHIIF